MMQTWLAFMHCFAGFGPHFCFHTTAADRACGLSISKEEHFRAAPLRRRAAGVRHRGDHNTFAARVGFANQAIEIILSNRTHN